MVKLRARAAAGKTSSPDESGQAITEYILLLAITCIAFLLVARGISKVGLAQRLMKPLQQDFARAYQYGHPKAKGLDEGPEYHVRAVAGGTNFRMFVNSRKQ